MNTIKNALLEKIKNRTAKVVVMGLGYVGLPKAASIAEGGFLVTGFDIDPRIVKAISKGVVDTKEPGLRDLIEEVTKRQLLKATLDGDTAVKESDIVIMCVPTPITSEKKPDLSFVKDACKIVTSNLKSGKLIIIESTLPPQTTKTLIAPILEKGSGLKCGSDFWLAYCPERITPGKALQEFAENARIVGGYEAESAKLATEFFKTFARGDNLITDATTAEVAKLAENTYRDVNIAFANQLALICEQVGVDVLEAIKLANSHPRVSIHIPGPGVGGSCLPKDPYLLTYSAEPIDSDIIKTARQMNDYMSSHVVKLILSALRNTGKAISNSRIAILGTAYKCDVGDSRFSPSEPVIHELIRLGGKILVYDPHCRATYGAKKGNSMEETVKDADCLVILTDHAEFKNLCLPRIKSLMKANPAIVDGKRIFNPNEAEKLGFFYLGVGLGISSNSILGLEGESALEQSTKNKLTAHPRRATD
jgi:UDP-N-acetyl-D-mannosaminuronic acid dehydrogenase